MDNLLSERDEASETPPPSCGTSSSASNSSVASTTSTCATSLMANASVAGTVISCSTNANATIGHFDLTDTMISDDTTATDDLQTVATCDATAGTTDDDADAASTVDTSALDHSDGSALTDGGTSATAGSGGDDFLFEPSVDMMVNDFDDEQTLDEEERLAAAEAEDPNVELSNLQREQEMPIEELLALYNCQSRRAAVQPSLASQRRQQKRVLAEQKELLAKTAAAAAASANTNSTGGNMHTQSSSSPSSDVVTSQHSAGTSSVPGSSSSTGLRRSSAASEMEKNDSQSSTRKRKHPSHHRKQQPVLVDADTMSTTTQNEPDRPLVEDKVPIMKLANLSVADIHYNDEEDENDEVADYDEDVAADEEGDDEDEADEDEVRKSGGRKVKSAPLGASLLNRRPISAATAATLAANSSSEDVEDDESEEESSTTTKDGPSVLHKLYPETFAGGANQRMMRNSDDEEEEEEDGDYSPGEDEFKKTIMVGSEFQAVIPEGLCKYGDALPYENEDKLVWDPSKMLESDVEIYEHKAIQLQRAANLAACAAGSATSDGSSSPTQSPSTPQQSISSLLAQLPVGNHLRDDEHSLYLLLQCGHNVEEALRRRRITSQPSNGTSQGVEPNMSAWSEEECRNFESGLRIYYKDFHTIQLKKVRTRSVGELVQFYYVWKKTQRHDVFANKARLDKKKYNLHPGLTDYMDRFLEEQECNGGTGANQQSPAASANGGAGGASQQVGIRDRSVSPSVNSLMYNNYRRYRRGSGTDSLMDTAAAGSDWPPATTTPRSSSGRGAGGGGRGADATRL